MLPNIDGYQPKHLSFSTVNGYRGCGKRFQLEKVMQLEQRPMWAGIGGNALHQVSERIDEHIQEHGFEGLLAPVSTELDNVTESMDESVPPF